MIRLRRRLTLNALACALALSTFATVSPLATPAFAEMEGMSEAEFGKRVRDFLMQNPEVLREALQELERKERARQAQATQDTIKAQAASLFRAEGDLVIGNPQGDVTLVEFMDYNCGYCKRSLADVMKLVEADKNVRVVIKEFPILGPSSVTASRAALASAKQGKYKELHMALMSHKGALTDEAIFELAKSAGLDVDRLKADMNDAGVAARIEQNHQIASALGIDGTPAFVIDQQLIPGALGFEALAAAVGDVRAAGGCKVC